MDVTAVRCEVVSDESLPLEMSRVRVSEFIRAQDSSHEFMVQSKLIRWLEDEKEQAYLVPANIWNPLFCTYVGLVAQIQTGRGFEDVYIHPDDFLVIPDEQSYF